MEMQGRLWFPHCSLTGDQVKCRGEEWKEGERRGGHKNEMEKEGKTDEEPLSKGL